MIRLKSIPENWKLIKCKYLFSEIHGGSWGNDPQENQLDGLVKVIRVSEFNMNSLNLNENIPTVRALDIDESSPKLLQKNDLILEKSGGGEKTTVGRVVLNDKETIFPIINSNFTNLCRPNQLVEARFLVYSLNELYTKGITKRNIKQTTGIQNLDIHGFMNEKILLPPLKEQKIIYCYLDKKIKNLNSLIEKIVKKIEILKEQRLTIINKYVSKGLNQNLDMKDSGIKWIGMVPAHWNIDRVGRTTYVKGRIGWKGLRSEDFIDEGPFLITGTDFNEGSINWKNTYHVNTERYEEDPFIVLKEDDVLITKDGSIGKVAHVNQLPGPTTLNSGIFVTRPLNNKYLQRYFFWIVSSNLFTEFIEFNSSGSTILHLYQNVFERFFFPFPPDLEEQRKISNILDKKINTIDLIIKKNRLKIDKLTEYRNSLISSLVTGKIRITEDML